MGPCDVKVCRICFAMDCELHVLHENIKLYKGYEAVTGLILANEEGLPHYLCTDCADQQTNFVHFMNRTLQAHLMLLDILKSHGHISVESIQAIIKTTQCDSDIVHTEEERALTNFQIDMKCEDAADPIAMERDDEVKIEFMPDDLFGDEAAVCVTETNIVKEEVCDVASGDLDHSKLRIGGDVSLDDGPSGQEDELNTVGTREEAEVTNDLNQMEGTEVNEKPVHNVTMSSDICGYENDIETQLLTHFRSHIKSTIVNCDTRKSKLNVNKIHLTEYSCDICKKSFTRKFILNNHMQLHSGENRYTCKICNRPFVQRSNLTRHMRLHSIDKPYSCGVCKNSYSSQKDVIRHMRIHSSKKPYSCSVCEKSFRCKIYLQRHMTTHSGEKPYTCGVCEKSLARKANLERHMLIHSSNKP